MVEYICSRVLVLRLIEKEDVVIGVRYRGADGVEKEVFAPMTFICDGCFSNLRKNLCTPKVHNLD
jgi:squalene monooxygenase